MKRVSLFAAVALAVAAMLLVAGCGTEETTTTKVKGIAEANFDTTVSPCDDFYEYAVGGWIKDNPIPPEYSSWSSWHEIYENNLITIRGILEDAAEHPAAEGSVKRKVGDFYYSAMDTARINDKMRALYARAGT